MKGSSAVTGKFLRRFPIREFPIGKRERPMAAYIGLNMPLAFRAAPTPWKAALRNKRLYREYIQPLTFRYSYNII